MLRRIVHRSPDPPPREPGRALKTLTGSGFWISDTVYDPEALLPIELHEQAILCLTVDGEYRLDWGRSRLSCGPASLVVHAPGASYGVQISEAGSHCLTVGIEPSALPDLADVPIDFDRLGAARRAPPHWLAFQLHRELELRDDLSSASIADIIITLLAELGAGSAFAAQSSLPPWLERVRDQIDDEFDRRHTLASLATAVGIHHVHLAREFRRRFGCTVGHYIRQRRIEYACGRLTRSDDPLAEVAFDAGFTDQSHFTNTFRQLVGLPPGTFRARFARSPLRWRVQR